MSERDDEVARALRAYASSTSGEGLDAVDLRRRILNDLSASPRRAPRKLSLVVGLAATFAASVALAATQPAVRAAVYRGVQALRGTEPTPPVSPRKLGPTHAMPVPSPSAASAALQPAPAALSPDDLPLLPRPSAAPSQPKPAASAAPTASPAPAAPNGSSQAAFDAQVSSYQKAHRQHFGGAAPATALAAWDEYLRAYPAGSFASDARFNRALCLIRLGRRDEARAALRPFSQAPVGSYRQQEAASLLLSLDGAAK